MKKFLNRMYVGFVFGVTILFFGNFNIYADEALSGQNCSQFNATNYQHVVARRALRQQIGCDAFYYAVGSYEDLGTNSGSQITTLYTTDGGQSYHVGNCPEPIGFELFEVSLVEGDPDLCKFNAITAGPEVTLTFDAALVETRSQTVDAVEGASVSCKIEVDFAMQKSHDDIYYASIGSHIDGGVVVSGDGTAAIDAHLDINGYPMHELVQTWNSPSMEAQWIRENEASLAPVFPESDQCTGDLQPLAGTITIRFDLSSYRADNILGIDVIGLRFNEGLCDGAPLSHSAR